MNTTRRNPKTLQEQIEAASRRIDETASDMLSVLEEEMEERDCDALEHAFRTRDLHFGSEYGG